MLKRKVVYFSFIALPLIIITFIVLIVMTNDDKPDRVANYKVETKVKFRVPGVYQPGVPVGDNFVIVNEVVPAGE